MGRSADGVALGAYVARRARVARLLLFARAVACASSALRSPSSAALAQFAQLAVRFETTGSLAAAQSLRLALALLRDVGRDLYRLCVSVQALVRRRFRARAGGDLSRLRRDLERRDDAGRSRRCNRIGRRSTCRSSSRRTPRFSLRSSSRASTCEVFYAQRHAASASGIAAARLGSLSQPAGRSTSSSIARLRSGCR